MFERQETWYFDAPAPKDLYESAWKSLSAAGFPLSQTSAYGFRGKSVSPTWGLHRLIEVNVLPWNQGATVRVDFRAAPTDEGLAVGVVGAIVFFPVAVVGGAISWDKYNNDWQETRNRLWNSLLQTPSARASNFAPPPPSPPPPATAPSPPPPAPSTPLPSAPGSSIQCPSCHAALPAGSKFCNLCGATVPAGT